ncbi:hypothetical protein HYW83_00090 [Candidatus Peregrinibacteria bacterium]|nr:hypothetical protein [Candidatus Peregrinibacteria bacterium]
MNTNYKMQYAKFSVYVSCMGLFAERSVPGGGTERADSSEVRQMPLAAYATFI